MAHNPINMPESNKPYWIVLHERGKGIDERDKKDCECKDPYPPYNHEYDYV